MSRGHVLLAAAAATILAGAAVIAATWHISYSHGIYCSVGLASTDGCDAGPRGDSGRWVAVAVILLAVPLLAAAFAQFHLDRVKLHVDRRLAEHHRSLSGQIGATTAPRPGRRRARYAAAVLLVAVVLLCRRARR